MKSIGSLFSRSFDLRPARSRRLSPGSDVVGPRDLELDRSGERCEHDDKREALSFRVGLLD